MNGNEIFEKLKEIFKMVNPSIDIDHVTLDSSLIQDIKMTSLTMVYMSVAIENEFDIDMSDVSFNSFETVKEVVKYIEENM